MEAMECGAASLAMILAYHGRVVPLTELRQACGISRDGSKASNVVKAARAYGLTARGFRKEPEEVRDLPMPAIAFWDFNHFLVVEGFTKDRVHLNDPASGPRTVSLEEFDRSFTGVILTFEPGEGFERGGEFPSLVGGLASRLHGSVGALTFGVLAGLSLILPGLLMPAYSRVFVDNILVGGITEWLPPLLTAMAVTLVFLVALSWLQQYVLFRLAQKLELTSSGRFFWHVLHLPVTFFDLRYAADVASRTQLNARIADLLSSRLTVNVVNLTMIVFYAIAMLRYDVLLAVVGVSVSLLNLVALRVSGRRRADASRRVEREQGMVLATSFQGVQNIETLKAGGTESDFFARWAGFQAKAIRADQELSVYTSYLSVVPALLTGLTTTAILIIGGQQIIVGSLSIGALVAFQYLIASFSAPVNTLVSLGGDIQEVEAGIGRLDDVLEYPTDATLDAYPRADGAEGRREPARLAGGFELRDITFGYSPLDPPLIEGFNLTVRPGARVALIGGSGSGKSTIARLLCGLYQPWSGEILFDGRPRTSHPREVMVSSLALVNQEVVLFEGSVTENITLWDATVPEAQVIQAGRDAEIHQDIAARVGGYASMVQEAGRNWSGGQRQRLEIARALVSDPSILVLDEATSALDPTTEQRIDDHLRRRGCSCLIVAHRLSTIRDCDEIVVLQNGRIVQRGTHDELIAEGRLYASLIAAA
jgi:NHLM bacteriocin system ABC transporter peptidase/ATP-binding protein